MAKYILNFIRPADWRAEDDTGAGEAGVGGGGGPQAGQAVLTDQLSVVRVEQSHAGLGHRYH